MSVETRPPQTDDERVRGHSAAEAAPAKNAPLIVAGWWGWRGWRMGRPWLRVSLPALGLIVALLVLWQLYAQLRVRDTQLLPTPLDVWTALVAQRDILWQNALVTLWETVVGFATALAAGVLCAVAIDFSPVLRRALSPLLVASQTIPLIVLAPLLVLWFGFGLTSKAIVILLVCFFPIAVALADGLRSADPELVRLFRAFGAGRWRIFWSVRLPGALPQLFSGVRIAITYSVIGAIFAEYVGASAGLGFYMVLKFHTFSTAGLMAAVAVTAALSIALFLLTALIERQVLPWYYLTGRHGAEDSSG